MSIVKLVELIDEDLKVKPTFFGLKGFYGFSLKPTLHYYCYNENQSRLDDEFRYFIHPYKNDEQIVAFSEGLHMNSWDYYQLVIGDIFENLNKYYKQNFKDLKELELAHSRFEFEYEHWVSNNIADEKFYSSDIKIVAQDFEKCQRFITTLNFVRQNLARTEFFSKYFEEIEEEIKNLRETGNKIGDVNACNNYLLKLYGLEEFISK